MTTPRGDADPSTNSDNASDSIQPPRGSSLAGWRGPLVGALVAVIAVFAILNVAHIVFPAPAPPSTRPLVINVQLGGSVTPGAASAAGSLRATPQSLTLACRSSASFALVATGQRPLQWTLGTLPNGLLLSGDSPQTGTLAPGQRASLTLIALGQSEASALQVTDDQGDALAIPITVRCP